MASPSPTSSSTHQSFHAYRRTHTAYDGRQSPSIPWSRLPPIEASAIRHQQHLRELLDTALPPDNAPPPTSTTPSLQQAVFSLIDLLYRLFGPRASPALLRALVAQRVPHDLVSALDRALRFRSICAREIPPPKPPIPGAPKPSNANRRIIELLIVALLRAFASSPHHVLRPARLQYDLNFYQLLFSAMFVSGFVEIALFLVEALLHLQTHPRLDLSQIPNLSILVMQLTPYQLGAFCRVISLVAEEPEGTSCASGICSGQCAETSIDWHHIKPMSQQLRERRSYLDPHFKALIHRNHATLLAIPGFLQRLVKLISRPPASRDDLLFVDHVTSRDFIAVGPNESDEDDIEASEIFMQNMATITITTTNNETRTTLEINTPHAIVDQVSNEGLDDQNQTADPATTALNNLHLSPNTNTAPGHNQIQEEGVITTPFAINQVTNNDNTTGTTTTVTIETQPQTALSPHTPAPTLESLMPGITEELAQIDADLLALSERHHGFGAMPSPSPPNTINTPPLTGPMTTTTPNAIGPVPTVTLTDTRDRRSGRNGVNATNGGASPRGRRRPRRHSDARNLARNWEVLDEAIASLEREDMLRRDLEDTESDIGSTSDASRVPAVGGIGSVDAVSTTATASDAGNEVPADAPTTEITAVAGDQQSRVTQNEASDVRSDGPTPIPQDDGAATDSEPYFNSTSQLRQHVSSIDARMLAHHVDVFFVLYCLVLGKRRSEVQAELIKANIFSVVKRYWYALEWVNIEDESVTEHNLKLHLVRFLHFMCDKTEDNTFEPLQRQFFSDYEKRVIKNIERNLVEKRYANNLMEQEGSELDYPTRQLERLSLQTGNLIINTDTECSVHVRGPSYASSLQYHLLHGYQSHQPASDYSNGTNLAPLAISWKGDRKGMRQEDKPSTRAIVPRVNDLDSTGNSATHERGLIMEITHTFMHTRNAGETAQLQRYMLSACLESFLRCATEAETVYLGQQGLLVHLLTELGKKENVISDGNQYRQTSFDVLSQLIRWSRTFFEAMNLIFSDNYSLLTQLLDAVSVRLIDSNVFVRSIALSLERFRAEDELAILDHGPNSNHIPYDFHNCVLWEFIQSFRVRILLDLLVSVRVEDVSYENICCVNTTLILFVLSCQDGESMDELLAELADETINLELAYRHQLVDFCSLRRIEAFENFAKLIDFWLGYYRHQGTDVHSLEVSSDIPIEKFVQVATMLKRRLPAVHEKVVLEYQSQGGETHLI